MEGGFQSPAPSTELLGHGMRGLIIHWSEVQVLPGPPIFALLFNNLPEISFMGPWTINPRVATLLSLSRASLPCHHR